MFDWNHFFASLRKYLDYFRSHLQELPQSDGLTNTIQTISESELAGLLSWTSFATSISLKDPESRRQIYEEKSWNCIESLVGLLATPIPLVLKGAFYKFLAALAIDEVAAVNIWNCLLCEGICIQQSDGKLIGIQQELDGRETQLKIYDCTQGFLSLMRELFTHKTRPGTQQITPFLQYIVNSILCQFSTRSYADSNQMWLLVKLALNSLYEPLKTFYATPTTVDNKVIEVQILSQLLNDSPLSRTLLQIIAEGSSRLQDESYSFSPSREEATFSAIRLLYTAISNRVALADAIRAGNSHIIVVSIESLLFSPIPLPQHKQTNYLSLLLNYINEADEMIRHTFFVWLILKEATAHRPSLQPRIIQSLLLSRPQLISSTAALSIFSSEDISVTINDLPPTNVDKLPLDRVKGEVCRLMFEVFNDSMESDPDCANIAYALMNFDLQDLNATKLEIPESSSNGITCLHNLLEIATQLTVLENPFLAQFSGLYESALRLILRLCSVKATSSTVMLRFLRSQYDLIYRLVNSSIFYQIDLQSATVSEDASDFLESTKMPYGGGNEECSFTTVHKSIQGIILELVALELSSLIKAGHIEQPCRYLKILMSSETSQQPSTAATDTQTELALIWVLLDSSRVFVDDFSMPQCNKFDPNKVEELLSLCIRKNSCNIDQFDVLYLHLLLNSEINCIMNTEIGIIREEARSILDYCTRKNARSLLEGACTHLLEGWLSLINVLSIQVPLHFIDIDTHKHLLVDALFLLRDYCSSVEMSPGLAESVASCISRLIRAICSIFANYDKESVVRESILPILHLLLQCIALPGYSKSVQFKIELYASCLRILDLFNSLQKGAKEPQRMNGHEHPANDPSQKDILSILLFTKVAHESRNAPMGSSNNNNDPMVMMVRNERIINDIWIQLIGPLTDQVVQTVTSDIVFAPLLLKMLATATFADLLREDSRSGGRIAREFFTSGSLQCVDDSLVRLQQTLATDSTIGEENRRRALSLREALISLSALAKTTVRNFA